MPSLSDEPIQSLLPTRQIRGFGWKRDLPDKRDLLLSGEPITLPHVPRDLRKFSLRERDPELPYDQGQLGSCTANGVAYLVQFQRKNQGLQATRPSRLFIYYGERLMEGTVDEDSGAYIRDGMRTVARVGAPSEADWPYDIARFRDRPPPACWSEGKENQVLRYLRCSQILDTFKRCMYAGYPVVFGFTVYESFASSTVSTGGETVDVARTGLMPMPERNEEVLGGHCTVLVGWDDDLAMPRAEAHGALEVRNSWGTNWGQNGYFFMPYDFALDPDYASDFWTCRLVEVDPTP